MCSGAVAPVYVLEAFQKGADGVFIGGCHPRDCHYLEGNYKTLRRILLLKKLLPQLGIEPERLKLEWVSAAEGQRFAQVVTDFISEIKKLGPNPSKAGAHEPAEDSRQSEADAVGAHQ
jgi:F420-non-reducing hydrogenase iron-sulfur subunit